MATLDINASTTTTTTVEDYEVEGVSLDFAGDQRETFWDFTDVSTNYGYYFNIPELKSAIDTLAIWTVGKGYELEVTSDEPIIDKINGWGKDTFQSIMENLIVTKKIIGDSFAEIIRNDKGTLVNLKPISPERVRLVLNRQGILKRYDIQKKNGKYIQFETSDILHLCNERVADQIHGTSVVDATKWVIDARNEALADERMIKHRELALGVLYVDTDNITKRNKIMEQYSKAVKNGEVLVLPKDTAELKDTGISPKDRLAWIQYLENFFYQAVRVPRVIATSEGFTEAGGKVGYLTFEPIYTKEQRTLELDIWNQLAIKIKFNRPASLGGTVQEDEAKNTGQLGFQPKDTKATVERE